MINISSPQDQLRQNRAMLLLIGGASSVIGLMLWSAMPFAANNPKSPVHISLRYFALISGLGCGISASVCGHQLQKISPLIRAIDAAEKDDFLTQLAASQYVQNQQHERSAMQALQPATQQTVAVSPEVQQPAPLQPASELPETTSSAGSSDIEGFRPLYNSVTLAREQGATDTQIIEKVLGKGGRKFGEGKAALQALLQLGQEQNW